MKFKKSRIHITGEDTVDLTKLEQDLTALGYERESQIEAPGQFAVRGGIIDVFPLAEEMPVRIELGVMRSILSVCLMLRARGR